LHGNGERELDFARGGLINIAYFILQLPASSVMLMAANCPNVSVVMINDSDCDRGRHLVSLDHPP